MPSNKIDHSIAAQEKIFQRLGKAGMRGVFHTKSEADKTLTDSQTLAGEMACIKEGCYVTPIKLKILIDNAIESMGAEWPIFPRSFERELTELAIQKMEGDEKLLRQMKDVS